MLPPNRKKWRTDSFERRWTMREMSRAAPFFKITFNLTNGDYFRGQRCFPPIEKIEERGIDLIDVKSIKSKSGRFNRFEFEKAFVLDAVVPR